MEAGMSYPGNTKGLPRHVGMEFRAQLELKLAKDVNNTKKCVHNYFGNKRKMKENVGTCFDKVEDVFKNDMAKAKVFSAIFCVSFY